MTSYIHLPSILEMSVSEWLVICEWGRDTLTLYLRSFGSNKPNQYLILSVKTWLQIFLSFWHRAVQFQHLAVHFWHRATEVIIIVYTAQRCFMKGPRSRQSICFLLKIGILRIKIENYQNSKCLQKKNILRWMQYEKSSNNFWNMHSSLCRRLIKILSESVQKTLNFAL